MELLFSATLLTSLTLLGYSRWFAQSRRKKKWREKRQKENRKWSLGALTQLYSNCHLQNDHYDLKTLLLFYFLFSPCAHPYYTCLFLSPQGCFTEASTSPFTPGDSIFHSSCNFITLHTTIYFFPLSALLSSHSVHFLSTNILLSHCVTVCHLTILPSLSTWLIDAPLAHILHFIPLSCLSASDYCSIQLLLSLSLRLQLTGFKCAPPRARQTFTIIQYLIQENISKKRGN